MTRPVPDTEYLRLEGPPELPGYVYAGLRHESDLRDYTGPRPQPVFGYPDALFPWWDGQYALKARFLADNAAPLRTTWIDIGIRKDVLIDIRRGAKTIPRLHMRPSRNNIRGTTHDLYVLQGRYGWLFYRLAGPTELLLQTWEEAP